MIASLALAGPAAAGGNHGCSSAEGSFYSSHFFASGDNIVAGSRIQTVGFPPSESESIVARNTESGGPGSSTLSCGGDPGAWLTFLSELGPGEDSIRLDAQGLQETFPEIGPLRRSIQATIDGGAGADVLRGHSGVDKITGGVARDTIVALGGDDVIQARDGRRDVVQCGRGVDRGRADPNDELTRCENVRRGSP